MENQLLELYHTGCRVNSEFSLRDITFALPAGSVLAIMGKNASGKSTLCAMLMGVFPIGAGEVKIDGTLVNIRTAADAAAQGILLLGQNQPIFENMKVYENIYFGQELSKGKLLDNARMREECARLLERLHIPVSPLDTMRALTYAQRQLISLARAMCSGARILLMDEPSTHMDSASKKLLWQSIDALKQAGKTVLLCTHDPEEALCAADRVAFMEDGTLSEPEPTASFDEESLVSRAYGVAPGALYERTRAVPGEELLRVEIDGIAFRVRRGEVVALLGDSHCAQGLLAKLGGVSAHRGTVTVGGTVVEASPIGAVSKGISLALDDEAEMELASAREVLDNGAKVGVGAKLLFEMQRVGSQLSGAFGGWVGLGRKQEYNTGGNRRREMVDRALSRRASVYLLMEPSAGLDFPAKRRMYERFGLIAKEGAALVFATGNAAEACGLADRLLILRDGKLVGEVTPQDKSALRALLEH